MAFGVVSALYFPVAANAGASMWGTDVRKLLDTADAGLDGTSIVAFGTGGAAVTRTVDPYTTSSTDADQTLFGWAIDPADMGSTADFIRSYPAGDHTLTARLTQSGLGAVNITMTLFIYRVGPSPTRTRTLLGSNSSVTNIPALNSPATATVTVSLGAITFAADETIQFSVELNATGVAVTGRNSGFRTGTDGGVAIRMDTPPLEVVAATTGSSSGSATADGVLSAQADLVGTASGVGTALGVPTAVTGITGTAAAEASAAGVLGATAGLVGSSAGAASTSGSLGATAGLVGSSTSFASTAGVLAAFADLVGTADGTSTAEGFPAALAGTIGTADGTSDALGVLGAILATIGTATVGAACPADWPINDGLKEVAGDVFFHEPPNEGDPVDGATVFLIRDSDGLLIASTTTDAAGHYAFPRDTDDPYTYHVEVRYLDQQGLSEGGCVPA